MIDCQHPCASDALTVIISICSFHFKSSLTVTPRIFADFTTSNSFHQTLGNDDLTFPTKSLTYLWHFSWHSSKGWLLLVPRFLLTHLFKWPCRCFCLLTFCPFYLPTLLQAERGTLLQLRQTFFSFLFWKLTLFSLPHCLLNQHIEFGHLWDPLQVDRLLIQLKLK